MSTVLLSVIVLAFNLATLTNGYVLQIERAELVFYNRSLAKNPIFNYGKINRTTSALNISFNLLHDLDDPNFLTFVSADQFFHNEYRSTGVKLTLNMCDVWKQNLFGIPKQLKEHGFNPNPCSLKKGSYQLLNYIPETESFPKMLPYGKYRMNIRCYYDSADKADAFLMQWYSEVKPSI